MVFVPGYVHQFCLPVVKLNFPFICPLHYLVCWFNTAVQSNWDTLKRHRLENWTSLGSWSLGSCALPSATQSNIFSTWLTFMKYIRLQPRVQGLYVAYTWLTKSVMYKLVHTSCQYCVRREQIGSVDNSRHVTVLPERFYGLVFHSVLRTWLVRFDVCACLASFCRLFIIHDENTRAKHASRIWAPSEQQTLHVGSRSPSEA